MWYFQTVFSLEIHFPLHSSYTLGQIYEASKLIEFEAPIIMYVCSPCIYKNIYLYKMFLLE